jgi:UDP-GlcNAc:undecaprenyl-phosphate GlcNAc-1-phosphate transferase
MADDHFLLCLFLFSGVIFSISAIITWLLARYLKFLDIPNERSSHIRATPRGGGMAIVAAFFAGMALIGLVDHGTSVQTRYFLGFLGAALVIAVFSVYDDFRSRSFKVKLAAQLLAIFIALLCGIKIDVIDLPWLEKLHLGWWGYPLTLMWLLGLTNAYNFMDGLDGLAAGTAVIAAFFLAIISLQQGSQFIYLAAFALGIATLGFLPFNLPPARIFMGDVGSTFLGLAFAVMAVVALRYDRSHISLFVVPLLLFHFIFDTTFTFLRRLLRGEKVFHAHRSHLYQLLNRLGYSHAKVTFFYAAMAVPQGLAAIWMAGQPGRYYLLSFIPFLMLQSLYAWWVMKQARAQGII